MRSRTVLLLGLALCVLVACAAPATRPAAAWISTGDGTWEWQWPLPQGNGLNDVTFAGASAGWSVGGGGTILFTADGGATWSSQASGTRVSLYAVDAAGAARCWAVGDHGTVVRTTDAGLTWSAMTIGADDLRDVSFVSATVGWALGFRWPADPDGTYASVLYRTIDGGTTWAVQKIWDAQQLRAIGFADASAGWAVGDGGRILRTGDGGVTWTSQDAAPEVDLSALCVVSASRAWVAGDGILETTDAGATWKPRATLDVWSNTFTSVDVDSEGHVAATGWYYPDETELEPCGMVATSADGGATWSSHFDGEYLEGVFAGVAFSSPTGVCAVGETGAVMRSTDGGVTWTGRKPLALRELSGVDFVDAQNGWAVGAYYGPGEPSSLVLRTADGGATWKEDSFSPGYWGAALSAVDFVNRRVGYAVGDAGLVLRSADGGAHWRTVNASRSGRDALYSVDLVGTSRGWAVGEKGRILTTTDGVHWRKQRSRTVSTLFGVSFATRAVGYAVGDKGCILKTSDGGGTWRPQASGTQTTLTAVDFVDDSHGWAVGASLSAQTPDRAPVVLRTVDGGRTWTPQTLPRAANLSAVDFLDRDAGWIAADDGTVFVTADGGETWAAQGSGVAEGLSGLVAVSETDIWAVSRAGGIVRRAVPEGAR